tara:strand:+ start:895 stop:1638 length:744 start_codon:yes stop_codon:yes gene_type:complete
MRCTLDNVDVHVRRLKECCKDLIIESPIFYKSIGTTLYSDKVVGDLEVNDFNSSNCIIRGSCSRSKNTKIVFNGSNNVVFLGPYSKFNNAKLNISGDNNIFILGAFSTVESITATLKGDSSITIGNESMLSSRIIIDTSDHHSIYDLNSGIRVNIDADVSIESNVWIGRNVIVCKGAKIGTGSIVAQASLVNGTLEPFSIYGGTPAKLIKTNVQWSRMSSDKYNDMLDSPRHKSFLLKKSKLLERCI